MTRFRRRRAAGGSLLLVLTLTACGASPSAQPEPTPAPPVVDTPAETAPVQTPATDETTTPPDTPTPTTPTPQTAGPVAYVPWGPDDPVIPQHYGELARRNCSAAASSSPGGEFWDAVVAVCRTLADGDPWPDLGEAPAPPETDNPHDRCLNAELAEMVTAALAWHAENGDGRPEVTYAAMGSPCYLNVYDTRQVPPEEDATAPNAGDVTVAVVLDSTYEVSGVSVDGIAVDSGDYADEGNIPDIGLRTLSVHVPAPDSPTSVSVEIALSWQGAERGVVTASVEVSPAAGAGASSPDDGGDGSEDSDS
jgi:hypothetical protein